MKHGDYTPWAKNLLAILNMRGYLQNAQAWTLLDIGCRDLKTSSRGLVEVFGPRYYGVDINREKVEEGRKWLKEKGLPGRIEHATSHDFGRSYLEEFRRDEMIVPGFDLVMASSVVIHLTDDLVERFLDTLCGTLRQNGHAIFNINEVRPEGRWEGLPFVRRDASFYARLAARRGFSTQVLGTFLSMGLEPGGVDKQSDHNTWLEVSWA